VKISTELMEAWLEHLRSGTKTNSQLKQRYNTKRIIESIMKVRHTTARSCSLWGLLCGQWRIPCMHLDEEGTLRARDLLSWLCLEVSVAPPSKYQNVCEITRQMLPSNSYWSKVVVIVTLLNSIYFLLWEGYFNEPLEK